MFREMWQDSHYGVRMLLKQPGFTLIAVLTLALGIGANTAIYSLVDRLIVRSLPVKDPAALVVFQGKLVNTESRVSTISDFSWVDYSDYRSRNQVFTELTAFAHLPVNLGSGDQMERVRAELVADNYFETLGVRPSLGRDFLPDENRTPGAHPVAMISHGLWRSRFGGDPRVVGQTVPLNEASYTIIGVTPPSYKGLTIESPADVWIPAMMFTQIANMPPEDKWVREPDSSRFFRLAGRLKPGVAKEAAQTAMDTIARQIRDSRIPASDRNLLFNEYQVQLVAAGKGISNLRDKIRRTLELLLAVVGLILLIACANVANLLLARSAARRKEIAIRLALGAGRARLVRQMLTESLILAGLGGTAGMLLAPWLTDLLLYQASPEAANAVLDHSINWRVAAFTLLIASLTGLLFGLIPALQASRPALVPALKDESALRTDSPSFKVSRRALVIAQVALSVIVLVCAGLFLRSLSKLLAIEPGFDPENVLVAELELPMSKYSKERSEEFYRRLLERLRALPDVQSVAAANYTPLSGTVGANTVVVEGQSVKAENELPTVFGYTVSAGYHELMGIPLLEGRGFTEGDRKGAPGVAVVNEAFVRRFFPNGSAVGRRVSLGIGEPWMEIVGVTRNVKNLALQLGEADPQLDLPVAQHHLSNPQRMLVRTRRDTANLLTSVRREVRAFDPGLAFFKTTTLKDDLLASIGTPRMHAVLISLFGAVALVLAAVGLYGVIAYSVAHRTREIGIRMALGAQAGDVLKLVMREGGTLIAVGLSIGMAAAWGATRLIAGHLYGVSPTDPLTFAAIALLLIIVTLLACWIPARRATKVDPMIALRYE